MNYKILKRLLLIWGYVAGILSAICYGANAFCKVLFNSGYDVGTVLMYRFGLGAALLAAYIVATKGKFVLDIVGFRISAILGILFAISSFTFYHSFKLMDVGIASTMVYSYPIFVAALMAIFFKEKLTVRSTLSFIVAFIGIAELSLHSGTETSALLFDHGLTPLAKGLIVVVISALAYAIYIVVVNQTNIRRVPISTLTFWVLFFCFIGIATGAFLEGGPTAFKLPHTPLHWVVAIGLAIVPTLLSLIFMTISTKRLGPTPTAILGAVEPVTAVIIGFFTFGEALSLRLFVGMALVMLAVGILIFKPRK